MELMKERIANAKLDVKDLDSSIQERDLGLPTAP
jgi:hypothetical protein